MRPHLWQGDWIDDEELAGRLDHLSEWAAGSAARRLDTDVLLAAADAYSRKLSTDARTRRVLSKALGDGGRTPKAEIAPLLGELASFLDRDNLERKLRSELGSLNAFLPSRRQYEDSVFEAWAPLGLLVHVAPSNSPTVAPLSVVEGLLSGNLNFLKISQSEGPFPQHFLKGLVDCDPTGHLSRFVVAARFSSRNQAWLGRLFSAADGIAVWGGEEAVQSVRKAAPPSARVIEWGHKISFIYLTAEAMRDSRILKQAAKECCLFEQQACSSPQCIYVDTGDWKTLENFGERLAKALAVVSKSMPAIAPSPAEQAEITLATELARQESCVGRTKVIEDPAKKWRVLIDARPALAASPLFRTIWVKPLPRRDIIATLRPMRYYLQTAGLACGLRDLAELSQSLLGAGAVRVRRVGEMAGSYSGEAHDGVYALQRYCRRVSVQAGPQAQGISTFADLQQAVPAWPQAQSRIMTKTDFQGMSVEERHAQLFFKSGGSSGEPKMSVFTYDDYHEQMRAGAEGLYAAGLDPLTDRSMNLFFSGGLYGGFLSIFSVLEELKAVQFPMAAVMDFPAVADAVVKNKVNVLLGMPSYIIELFEKGAASLGKYRGVDRVFYGGEHFNDAQRRYLRENFGVKTIRSVGYGSVDAGPLGYQCIHSEGSVHHLHQRLQRLEIVELQKDRPITTDAVGRLIFTSLRRKGQNLERYELGDVGQWVKGDCPCGRASPRFRLLGRSGDVMRIGSSFINYQRIVATLAEKLAYAGPVQLRLCHEKLKEKLTVRVSGLDAAKARAALLSDYHDLGDVVQVEKMLAFEVEPLPSNGFERTKGSGKLVRIIDARTRS
jgi:phenylacetate-coenzyme A ligase PaaK-like adenylate-forming protein